MTPIVKRASTLCLAAAALIVSSEILRLAVGLAWGSASSTTLAHSLTYGLALAGMDVLLLALTAVYVGNHQVLGTLGLVGYLTASLGTVLVAGDWWFEAFAVPMIGSKAPQILTLPASGSILAGAMITVALFGLGWILFGVAALRGEAFSRSAAVLLIVGGVCGIPLALSTPYQVPLAVAVGWLGHKLRRTSRRQAPVGSSTAPGRLADLLPGR